MRLYTSELVKKYKARTVVNHVSIDVNQGEIVGLLGPNGAGKTTTFYMNLAKAHRNMTCPLFWTHRGRCF
jgi:ABC-type lipopolysaccharide export system ATPase subunit